MEVNLEVGEEVCVDAETDLGGEVEEVDGV